MKDPVQHHRTKPRDDHLDRSFGGTVLVMRTESGESDRLDLVFEVALKLDGVKSCVVSSECLDLDIELS
jgi:hypothetical protein